MWRVYIHGVCLYESTDELCAYAYAHCSKANWDNIKVVKE